MEVFSDTRILQDSWGMLSGNGGIQTLSKHSQKQNWWLLSHDPCGWPLGGWNSKSGDGRADPRTQDQVHCLTKSGWKDADQVSPQALGSAMQASSHVPEGSVQKDARSLWDWEPRQYQGTLCTWRFSLQVMCGYLALPLLLYLSGDLPQCQYVIRYLSTFSSKPTEKAMVVLRHPVGYIAAHAVQCVSLKWKRDSLRRLQRLPDGRSHCRGFQWCRLGGRQANTPICFWKCHFLWDMHGLLLFSNSEGSILIERRVWNIRCCFSRDGCHPHSEHLRMASSTVSHVDVFVFGFICSKGYTITKRGRQTETSELSSTMFQDLVSERRWMVKAVFRAVNPADVATKRLSAARIGSLSCPNCSVVGARDPANIFRHVNIPSRQHIKSLMSTSAPLGTLSQLTQLQGCTDSNPFLFSAMDVVPAESQFAIKVVVTWLLCSLATVSTWMPALERRLEILSRWTKTLMSWTVWVESRAWMEWAAWVKHRWLRQWRRWVENVEGHPAFSPEGLLHWLYGRCTRRELFAASNQDPARVSKYQQRKSLLQEITYLHTRTMKNMRMPAVCCIWWWSIFRRFSKWPQWPTRWTRDRHDGCSCC